MIALILPLLMSGLRLSICHPQIIFGEKNFASRNSRMFYSMCAFLITPFHSTFLHLKKNYIELKIKNHPNCKSLLHQRDQLKSYLCNYIKLELGMEAILQLSVQLILYLNATSETPTNDGLNQMFKEDSTWLQALLVLSMLWSMSTCVISHIRGVSGCREYFPLPSKVFMGLYAFCAISSRVMAMIVFFASPLGLFSLLRHVQFEQIKVGGVQKIIYFSIFNFIIF